MTWTVGFQLFDEVFPDCGLHPTLSVFRPRFARPADICLHDMTGGSTWLPGMLTNLFPGEVNAPAIQAGTERAKQLLQKAASLTVGNAPGHLRVTVTNECDHKLPAGYPEGRRMWFNVSFYDDANNLLNESGEYNEATGELNRDAEAKIYKVHPGIDTNISGLLGLDTEASLHFVLNHRIYEDNRIPPRVSPTPLRGFSI